MLLYHSNNIQVQNSHIIEVLPYILQFYDKEVSLLISTKYGYSGEINWQ